MFYKTPAEMRSSIVTGVSSRIVLAKFTGAGFAAFAAGASSLRLHRLSNVFDYPFGNWGRSIYAEKRLKKQMIGCIRGKAYETGD